MLLLLLATYSFEVVHTDTVVNINPNEIGVFKFTLTNTGTDDDVYGLDLIGIDMPQDWFVQFCYAGQCLYSGLPYRVLDTIPAGESDTTISIEVFTDTTHYNGIMRFTISSRGDPSLSDTFFLYVNTTQGIGEVFHPIGEESNIYFTIDGRRVKELGGGIYFIKDGKSVRKVVIIK